MIPDSQATKKLLVIEGNIGAGKTTLLNILHKKLNVAIIPEPLNRWQEDNPEENLLNLFYKNTPRWAYTFQSYAFLTRVQAILDYQAKNTPNEFYVLERSIYCDRFCFAKNCHESGFMTNVEWNLYTEWFSWLAETYVPQ